MGVTPPVFCRLKLDIAKVQLLCPIYTQSTGAEGGFLSWVGNYKRNGLADELAVHAE